MAIAFDDASNSAPENTWVVGASTVTSAKANTGSNIFIGSGVGTYNASLITVSSIVYNTSESLALIESITASLEAVRQDTELWGLDNASSGTHNIVYTLSGTSSFFNVQQVSYTGKTTSGIDSHGNSQNTSASTASPACNCNVVHTDCWQFAYFYSRLAGNLTAGAGTTLRVASNVGHAWMDSNGVVGTGNQTLAAVANVAATWPGVVSAAISAANAGGGGASTPWAYRFSRVLGVGPHVS